MLLKNASEQTIVILNLFYLWLLEKNACFIDSEFVFLSNRNKINFRIT